MIFEVRGRRGANWKGVATRARAKKRVEWTKAVNWLSIVDQHTYLGAEISKYCSWENSIAAKVSRKRTKHA